MKNRTYLLQKQVQPPWVKVKYFVTGVLKVETSSPSTKERDCTIYIIPQDWANDEKYIKHFEYH